MGTQQTATYNVLSDYLDIVDRVADLSMEERERCKAALLSCDYKTVYARVKEKCIAKGIAEKFLNELEETFPERFVIYFAEGYAEGIAEVSLSSRPTWSTRASSRTGSKATEKPCLEKT